MKISRILHAGYVFESGDSQIIFDPIFESPFSKNCYSFPKVSFQHKQIERLRPKAIFISHYHDDHCSFESLWHLSFETPIYIYCVHEELFELIRQLGFMNVYSLTIDVPVHVGEFIVTPRLALDEEIDALFQIQSEGLNVLNVVDAWIHPGTLKHLIDFKWDMVLWPFQTMREIEVVAPELAQPPEMPEEWLDQLKALSPKFVVPSSCQFIHEDWSWYRKAYFPVSYREFQLKIKKLLPRSFVRRLNPGESVNLDINGIKVAKPLSWIEPIGPQNVDYEFDSQVVPQSTAYIAQQLSGLSTEQLREITHFCENRMCEIYSSLNLGLTGTWRLEVYDQSGTAMNFCYKIQDTGMALSECKNPVEWVTEIPAVKLFAALKEGESLSSLYLRMRGMPYDEIENDPLIATLYNEDLFSYQRFQLKKIKGK